MEPENTAMHIEIHVMPEHIHLLVSEPERDTLADAMKLRRLAGV